MNLTAPLDPERAAALGLLDDLTVVPAGIVSRTLLQADRLRVMVFSLAEGQELTTHTNARRALVQVLTGEGDFQFNGAWRRLPAGTLLHLPPHHPHAVRAGAGALTLLLTLATEP